VYINSAIPLIAILMLSVVENMVDVATDEVGAVSKKSEEQAANENSTAVPANMFLIYLFISDNRLLVLQKLLIRILQ
jgi:hypothetical protein